jgi:hypothetical protein
MEKARRVLRTVENELMTIPGVIGVGVGESKGRPCINVYVNKWSAEIDEEVPAEVKDVPVVIVEAGEVSSRSGEG